MKYLVIGKHPVFGVEPGRIVERRLSEAESLLLGKNLLKYIEQKKPKAKSAEAPAVELAAADPAPSEPESKE